MSSFFKKLKVGQVWIRDSLYYTSLGEDQLDEILDVTKDFVRYKRGGSNNVYISSKKDFKLLRSFYKDNK